MKFIVTEQQNMFYTALRRIAGDYDLIKEIVENDAEFLFGCDDELDDFLEFVCESSSRSYLFHYFETTNDEGFDKLQDYLVGHIMENFSKMLEDYWEYKKEECDEEL